MRCDLSCLSCLKCDLSWMQCTQAGATRNFVHVIWMSIVAWIFSVVALADCSFVRNGFESSSYNDLNEVGLFNYNLASDEHQCVSYSNTVNFSAAAKTARAFGVICCLLTSFAMLQVLSLQLFLQYKRDFVWKNTRIQVIAAPLAQLLMFTAFGDDLCLEPNVKCVPGAAGIMAIFNVLVLIALACMCWITTPPEQPLYEIKRLEDPPPPEQKPTTVEDMESDGHSIEAQQEQAIYSYSKRDASEDIEAQPEQAIASNFNHEEDPSDDFASSYKCNEDSSPDELDAVVKSVGANVEEGAHPGRVRSLRPISPDSEKRRLSFSPPHSKGKIETSTRLEV